jgi:hypothetical protein
MQSKSTTVAGYLRNLPVDRRLVVSAVRDVILANLGKGYEEGMQYGMIGYYVPHSVFPAGYHCDPTQPLPFAAIAAQKNYYSVYLMGVYCGCYGARETELATWFREAWVASGRKLNMGASCVRFTKIEDCALDVLGEAIRRVPAEKYIRHYESTLALLRSAKAGKPKASSKATKSPKSKAATAKPAAAKSRSPK